MAAIIDVANLVPSLWDFGSRLRKDFGNRSGFLHACYFEARLNLDLLDSVNPDALEGAEGTAAFAELANCLETSALLAMVAGGDRGDYNKLVKFLAKYWQAPRDLVEEEVKDVLDNFSFAARKIEGLRRISRVACKEGGILTGFRLKVRLANIKSALLSISNCLRDAIAESED
ncbi:MAG: hypothetical protein FWE09_07195 [Treponema sp.]|nr:hypothetical protein [Treponema sp.]